MKPILRYAYVFAVFIVCVLLFVYLHNQGYSKLYSAGGAFLLLIAFGVITAIGERIIKK